MNTLTLKADCAFWVAVFCADRYEYTDSLIIHAHRGRASMAAHWKRSFRLNVIAVLLILGIPGVSLLANSADGPRLDVTRLFSFEANSTCRGEPPTPFETRSGELRNCSVDEFNARFAVDGDPNTRWQSQNGDDPVVLTFTLSEVSGRVHR
jgi:hypothetical protein